MEQRYAQYAVEKAVQLLAIDSPTGFTDKAAEWVLEAFASLGFDARKTTKGGILIDLGGEESAEGGLLLQAHTDTLGAMVAEVKANGRLRVTSLGGMRAENGETENVRVYTRSGKVYEGTLQLCNASVHVNGEYAKTNRTFDTTEILLDENVSSAEETRALLRRAQAGDVQAAERMVEENTGLIWSVARRFFGRGVEPDDLYQLGCVGFLKAMQGFDEQFGTCFSTYAVPKIAGEIRRFLRDDGAVKVSRSMKERAQGIRTARTRLEQTLGREPTLSELAAETGLEPEEIAAAETATGPTESLQRENGETGFTLEHTLGDYEQETRMVEYADLREALRRLPERERQVIALRFYHGLTQQRAAELLHISQVQVSRLERRAVERMRVWLDA